MISEEQAIRQRHTVRKFIKKPLEESIIEKLSEAVVRGNSESGLNMQLIVNEPDTFNCLLSKLGSFRNVDNYLAIVADKDKDFDEIMGYEGEKIVVLAQQLGLNSCWVAGTFSRKKSSAIVSEGQRLALVIALGYGQSQGKDHKRKTIEQLSQVDETMPEWFWNGMELASLAPPALTQQKFLLDF